MLWEIGGLIWDLLPLLSLKANTPDYYPELHHSQGGIKFATHTSLNIFDNNLPIGSSDIMIFFGGGVVCFSDPICPPRSSRVWFSVRKTYTSLTFKRVTQGSAIKTQLPSSLLLQVHEGVIERLERTNNLENLVQVPWSGCHYINHFVLYNCI